MGCRAMGFLDAFAGHAGLSAAMAVQGFEIKAYEAFPAGEDKLHPHGALAFHANMETPLAAFGKSITACSIMDWSLPRGRSYTRTQLRG